MYHSLISYEPKKKEGNSPPIGDEVNFACMIHKCNFIWPNTKMTNSVLYPHECLTIMHDKMDHAKMASLVFSN